MKKLKNKIRIKNSEIQKKTNLQLTNITGKLLDQKRSG